MQSFEALVSNIDSDSNATGCSTLFMPLKTAPRCPLPPPICNHSAFAGTDPKRTRVCFLNFALTVSLISRHVSDEFYDDDLLQRAYTAKKLLDLAYLIQSTDDREHGNEHRVDQQTDLGCPDTSRERSGIAGTG